MLPGATHTETYHTTQPSSTQKNAFAIQNWAIFFKDYSAIDRLQSVQNLLPKYDYFHNVLFTMKIPVTACTKHTAI